MLKPRTFTEAEQAAAEAARRSRTAAMKEATKDHKKVWADENWWITLASERGIRLPPMWVPATPSKLKGWLKRLKKVPFREHFGCSPEALIRKNPKVPLRAFVGQMLEP
jgi:hypothetical protein